MIFSKHYQVTSDHHDLFTAVTDLGGDCKLDIYSSDVMLGKVRRQSFFLYFHWAPMLLVDRTTQVVCIVLSMSRKSLGITSIVYVQVSMQPRTRE